MTGTYFLDKFDYGNYNLHGSVKIDVTEVSPVFESVSRLNITFIFLQGDLVIHEEVVRLKGEANEYIEFSKIIESDKEFESSAFARFNFRVTELPAMGVSKKSTTSGKHSPSKTFIRIEKVEWFYENGLPKFISNPGDILEVIRVKTCISGIGTCWQVRNTKTGETGFKRADLLFKQRHTVYEEELGPTSAPKREERFADGMELPLKDFTGTYHSEINGKVDKYIKDSNPEVKLVQSGNTITGTYGDSEGKIWGKVDGNTIKFDWKSSINAGYGTGKWTFKPGTRKVRGTWFTTSLGSGEWNLFRQDSSTKELPYANRY
jgi:hypothetical protein